VGAFAAAAFHLMTHAFFKALLFLGSGSVIHGMGGEQDMQRMGGLRRALPVTFATMMIGTLAIAGVPPLSGFFSKDEILYRTFLDSRVLWTLAAITAGMTAFYMFRLMTMTFYGEYRGPGWQASPTGHGHGHGAWHGPHESPRVMTVPLMLLAAGAVLAGFVGIPAALGGGNAIEHFLEPSFTAHAVGHELPAGEAGHAAPAEAAHGGAPAHGSAPAHGEGGGGHLSTAGELGLMALSVVIAVFGIGLAWQMYVRAPGAATAVAARVPNLYHLLKHKYFVDEVYDATAVAGTLGAAKVSWRFDQWVVDGFVNASGWLTRAAAWLSGLADKHGVDGMVNATGNSLWEASFGYRRLQTGLVQNYALMMVIGVAALVGAYLFLR
jgi:NADH-quinone oxidoreductase subunit L